MKIIQSFPPNYDVISATFDLSGKTPIFCYGDIIYSPYVKELPEHLIVHEEVHSGQQEAHAGGVEGWWKDYLESPSFRLEQELEAYRRQYQFVKAQSSRQVNRDFLKTIARDLSSAMYGHLVTKDQAIKLISE